MKRDDMSANVSCANCAGGAMLAGAASQTAMRRSPGAIVRVLHDTD
jgi:hypothetical protein